MSASLQGPAIVPAGAPGARPPQIDAILPAIADALARETGRSAGDVQVVRASRRDHSLTWELRAGGRAYILKWLPLRASREAELAALSRQLFARAPHIRTPSVACNPTEDTFLVEKLDGEGLQSFCTAPPLLGLDAWTRRQCRIFTHVGEWLERFHGANRCPGPAPLDGVRTYLGNREAAFDAIGRELSDVFWQQFNAVEVAEPVRVHGDFTPHNILVSGESVAVIDLAGISEFEVDTRAFDAAAMVVGVEEAWRRRGRNYLRFASARVYPMIRAFLDASGVAPGDPAFAVCYAARHITRVFNVVRRTGKRPGPRSWHVQRIRLALEHPERLGRFGAAEAA